MDKPTLPTLKHSLIQCRYIFVAGLLFVIVAIVFSLLYPKAELFLALTPWHHPAGNYFFWTVTQLGNGIFAVILAVILLVKKQYKAAILLLLSYALSGILAQSIKHLYTEPRPYLYFKEQLGIELPIVEGETVLGHSGSFPSGHTATIFSIITALAMSYESMRKNWGWLLLAGILVAYSRMYLSNHFLLDVGVGALVGMLSSVLAYWIMYWLYARRSR